MSAQGILNLDKPPNSTSFQVVALVRKLSHVRKIGHAGTLDPMATGVLLVCLGQAVRVSEYLMELPKTYTGTVRLGISTDTYDATGTPVSEGDISSVDEATIRSALQTLQQQKQQTPPTYSAVKVGGTPAHRLARAGRPVSLRPRKASIERIDLLAFRPPTVEIEVRCGKGTYIRSLANDLGVLLGCGAHLQALRRSAVGPFKADEAASLNRLESAFEDGSWRELLHPLDYGLLNMPAVHLEIEAEKDVLHGCPLDADSDPFQRLGNSQDGQLCRAYGEDGAFVAVLRCDTSERLWRPQKVFAPTHSTRE